MMMIVILLMVILLRKYDDDDGYCEIMITMMVMIKLLMVTIATVM